jgi:PAS domain S-box-containing protein
LFNTFDKYYGCVLVAPLVTEDTVVGFVVLGRERTGLGSFDEDTTKLVSIISSQAGAVLRSAALYEQSVEQRVLEMSALYELSRKVRAARSLNDALNGILDIVASVVWSDVAEIHTIDYDARVINREACRGDEHGPDSVGFDDKTIASWVLNERKAILITDNRSDTRFREYLDASSPYKALMAIPIYFGEEVLAVLVVQAGVSGVYNEDNVKMLSLIATQAASLFRDMESLRELTTYTDNILRSIAAAVVTLDANEQIVTLNPAAERILRTKSAALSGQQLAKLLDRMECAEADSDDIQKMVLRAVETRQIVQCHGLKLFTTGDQEPVTVNGSASQLLTERGEYLGVVLVFEDITKEDEMQEELIRISRLAEIGQLAAGIAHELRNPLASIKGAAQVLLGDLPDDLVERHGEFLDIIVREVDGLNAVTTEFLEFSRPAPINWERFSLNELLEKRLGFMAGEFGGMGIRVHTSFEPDIPSIQADSNQLERAFVNIVLNAAQAMPEGGGLAVGTKYIPATKDSRTEGHVVVTVTDTGIGIPKSRIEKIFAPFFTTKTKGTGLGLPLVQKIVEAHGGMIKVDSEIGEGTTFTITLPVSSSYSDRIRMENLAGAEITELRMHGVEKRPLQTWSAGLRTITSEEE